jgi:UDP-glucose 4-epimerase
MGSSTPDQSLRLRDGAFKLNRYIVTGGAGFIGSHLVDQLVANGNEVTVIDNLAVGRRSNLETALASGQVELHEADVSDFDAIAPLFEGAPTVFHLAGLADIIPSVEHPLDYHRANVDGTASVMQAAKLGGTSAVVYAASSSCYGIPDQYPTPESAAIQPQYPYALTKNLGEQIVLHWGEVYGIDVVALRLFNVYGPRARTSGSYGAVFGVFLAQRLANQPLTIVGDGSQSRDFTYVADVVDAFIRASESGLSGEIFNVGSGGPHSVNDLVKLIGGETTHIPKRPGEPDQTFADISKIKNALDWTPKISFEEGVSRVLSHIDDWHDAPVWTPNKINEVTRSWFDNLEKKSADV